MSNIELYTGLPTEPDLREDNNLAYDAFLQRVDHQLKGASVGLLRLTAEKYRELQPIQPEQFDYLSEKYKISPDVLHVILMQQSGISAAAGIIQWNKLDQNLFPSLPDIEVHPTNCESAPWTLKSYFAAPADKTPYQLESDSITFYGQDTGIQVRRSFLKQKKYIHSGHYVYNENPCAVTVNPIDNPCEESCTFCPVSYTRKSNLYQGNIHSRGQSTHVTSPEEAVRLLQLDSEVPPLSEIERLAVVTARFPEGLSEENTYPAYSARLVQEASKQGFSGSLFMLAASTPEEIFTYRKYAKPGIPSIYAHTLEVYNDEKRRRLMPGDKGNNTFAASKSSIFAAREIFTETGFFYIAGIEERDVSIKFLEEISKIEGVKPWVHALNAYGPGIMNTMDKQNVVDRVEDLLAIQRQLIDMYGPLESYNLYSLIPHGSSLDVNGRLVYQ